MFIQSIIRGFLIAYAPAGEGEGGGDGGDGGEGDGQGDGGNGGEGDGGQKSGIGSGMFDRRKKDDNGGEGDGDGQGDGQRKGEGEGDKGKGEDGRPEGLADKFWNAETGEVRTDALIKSQADLEKQIGKLKREKSVGGEVPEKAEDYFDKDFALPEEVTNLSIEGPDDPGLKAWGEVCLKRGIGKELAADLVKDMFMLMNDQVEAPIDPDAEFDKLGKQGPAILEGVHVWATNLEKNGQISEADAAVINTLSETADGVRFLSAMRSLAGEKRIPFIPAGGKKGMSEEQWHEEYKTAVKEKDFARQKELDEIGTQLFGDGPNTGGRVGRVDHEKTLKRG